MTRVPLPARRQGPFEDFSSDIERMFDSVLGRTFGTMLRNGANEKFVPTLDLAESGDSYEVHVDLPGIKPDEVKVELHEGHLVISGQRELSTERKEKNYHYVERSSGAFLRSVALPGEVDHDKIDAQFDNGVLRIKLPKSVKAQPKKIEIRKA